MIKAEICKTDGNAMNYEVTVSGPAQDVAEEFASFAAAFAHELNCRSRIHNDELGTTALKAALDWLETRQDGSSQPASSHIKLLD